ncbi:hypothetical protein LR48_Vigan350s000500 [Vigna angularis]|uniref:Uncharacterized protein n=1 Tax=Phaseolus angularis TaxID=3914 RepID=A0A0L9T8S0_PHAAN|nr:hypothetical protein LR48_Vigan350s000500 [Vigna angularis]
MNLMKEVKWDRDGITRGHKKCKRGEAVSTAQRQLPLSGTLKNPLAPMRGKMLLRGRIDHVLLPLNGEFGERSEEGERWNQKRHQKVQKEKPQLPLSGSLPLSGTQELTGDPLRGKMAAEGKKPTHTLIAERYFTAERHTYGLGPKFSVILE